MQPYAHVNAPSATKIHKIVKVIIVLGAIAEALMSKCLREILQMPTICNHGFQGIEKMHPHSKIPNEALNIFRKPG